MTEQIFFEKLFALQKNSQRYVVAIDGGAGSGKSTLAEKMRQELGAQVIHMDDFFLQAHQRSDARLLETGGNIDYERFEQEILLNLRKNIEFEYQKFDCSQMKLADFIRIKPCGLIVIEGVYSLSPRFIRDYDLKVFMKVERETQLARILARSGKEKYELYKSRWLPLEDKYFSQLQIEKAADVVIE